MLHGFSGIDAVSTTRVAAGAGGLTVSSLSLRLCSGGVLGTPSPLGHGWPVPYDGTQFSVETWIPYAPLGMTSTTPARFGFVLLQDGGAPVRIPESGEMLTLSPSGRRRSVRPALEGPGSVVDGLLGEWVPSEKIASAGRWSVWKSIEAQALFLRFDVQPAAPDRAGRRLRRAVRRHADRRHAWRAGE